MAHAIPKFVYGALNTTIELDYPPKDKGQDEFDDTNEHTMVSLSGRRQVQADFIEASRKLVFGGLSEAKKVALRSFFRTWAWNGGVFRYYDDKNSSEYTLYELGELRFQPKRTGIVGANAFTYEVPFSFRRAEDEDMTDFFETSILNNQASAVNLIGVTLDSSAYKSCKLFCEIRRKTDSAEHIYNGYLTANYKVGTGNWAITAKGTFDTEDDDHGMVFSMSGGQVQYTSDNLSGANYEGTFKVKSLTF